jgi:hypothetical protein
MHFLLYAGHGLVDANLPTVAALRDCLRLKLAGRPPGMSDLYVLIFDHDGRFLDRRGVMVQDGHPCLVPPRVGRWDADQSSGVHAAWADAQLVEV